MQVALFTVTRIRNVLKQEQQAHDQLLSLLLFYSTCCLNRIVNNAGREIATVQPGSASRKLLRRSWHVELVKPEKPC